MAWLIWFTLLSLLPAALCWRRAVAQNHSPGFYALVGLLLSWGGVLITLRATQDKLHHPSVERMALSGAVLELDTEEVVRLEAVAAKAPEPIAGLFRLARENGRLDEFLRFLHVTLPCRLLVHHQQRLLLCRLLKVLGVSGLVAWVTLRWVIAPFGLLFEGMSLTLPAPTRVLLNVEDLLLDMGPAMISLMLGLGAALSYIAYRRWFSGEHRLEALIRSRACEAADPGSASLRLATRLRPHEREVLAIAAEQGRLGRALDVMLEQEVLKIDARGATPFWIFAMMWLIVINAWLLFAVTAPFCQLCGNLS